MYAAILDGSSTDNVELHKAYEIIKNELANYKYEIRSIILRETKIAPCSGCFNCWLKTPGVCSMNDAGRNIARLIAQSELFIFLTPVTFGGYSSDLKKAVDMMAPLALPFFIKLDGKTHHPPRLIKLLKFIAIGWLPCSDVKSEEIFKDLVIRNSRNFINSICIAEILLGAQDGEILREKIKRSVEKIQFIK